MNPAVFVELKTMHHVELGERIGGGGFGDVYRARVGGVSCAIKILREPLDVLNGAATKEFESLDVTKSVSGHPRIVTLFDVWTVQGYLVTRWELGQKTLADRLRECRAQDLSGIPRDELLGYLHEAAEGIDFLNQKTIYHRDIKPENLLLVHGHVKLADLGLAKFVGASSGSNTGFGTLGYMPPEAYADRITSTSDLYSLAAAYLKLRTGHKPFGTNTLEVLERQKAGQPVMDGLSDPEATVVRQALQFLPEHRPKDGATAWVVRLRDPRPENANRNPLANSPSPVLSTLHPANANLKPLTNTLSQVVSTLPEHFTNSIGMQFVLISPGSFLMGAPYNEYQRNANEGPQHRVTLTQPFQMGVYEVTQAEYERVMDVNPSHFSPTGKGSASVTSMDTSRFPVEQVSWDEANEFCKKLSSFEEERVAGRLYRLPTEAEWEYACRAGTTTPFHLRDSLSSKQANFDGNYPYGGAEKGPNLGRTTTVGSYPPPNDFGLFDMHGNVWEWCQDYYHEKYYAQRVESDPQGPSTGNDRVSRGGSWMYVAAFTRAAFRIGIPPDFRLFTHGFRVVCAIGVRTS
ncbi:MAG: SUMF1/EgtB/PvdO family nonheme iron enzyme [Planctomycetales bacterium]|nr:SUMF1/EgtB/PvdO family nonheme iron enzyme [Planctomycetales bacterium]